MDMHTRAVLGNKAVPDGRMERWMEETLMRVPQWVCQNGISDGQEDGCNRDVFLYSDRRSTAGGGVVEICKPGGDGAVRCQLSEWM